jgi:ribose transport system permease protein/ribose transport system ATP-binding protein
MVASVLAGHSAMASTSLDLSGISKRYPGVQALDGVDLSCRAGEIHAVLGENGSGKSTLLGVASGAVAADEGKVTIMGEGLTHADPRLARRLGLATVYQDDSLVRELTVAENLVLGATDDAVTVGGRREWAARQLAPYDLGISPDMLVGELNPAQRQFLEIVKALAAKPKVLLLDEPTSSLDHAGVEKLSEIIRRSVAGGAAVVYVSHRLPEILALADRVTILRDGTARGTYEINDSLSENDLVALMVGRPIDAEFPPETAAPSSDVVLAATNFAGARFRDVSLQLRRGEILGFAGAEGNGQREALRALGGLAEGGGLLVCDGKPVRPGNPRDALAAGILSLSSDRAAESIFPALGLRENMTVQVLRALSRWGLVSAAKEDRRVRSLVEELNIFAATMDQPIGSLSGGNQQKSVLARSFLYGAKAVLVDEPTQGVDAHARYDIYRAVRAQADQGVGFIVNSSDAKELAGLCDRVLVFSRGRVIRELAGRDISEENIVAAFLRSTGVAAGDRPDRSAAVALGPSAMAKAAKLVAGGSNSWWVPLLFLLLLTTVVGGYAAARTDVFLTSINIRHILLDAAPLALVTMAQFNVLMVRGFDISVGSLMSITVVVASFLMADGLGWGPIGFGVVACLAIGAVVGLINGATIRFVGINSVITTIAMFSILQGIALYLRPTPVGTISEDFMDLAATRLGFMPLAFIAIVIAAIAGDFWLYRTRSGLRLRAVGFREEAANRNGVRVAVAHLRAYLISGVVTVFGGFMLASQVGVGDPVIGQGFTLSSIAAAVLGGAALSGGRGSFLGAVFGAFFFTLTVNMITLLGFTTGAGVMVTGALTLFAVLLYSGWQPVRRLWVNYRRKVGRRVAALSTS